jgi:23S rRNA (adenine2030-N6)-methyltransferase
MNYRHAYHAANFADVVKHIVLLALIKSLQRKDKGFLALDCFSGIGIYDLHSNFAGRSPEYLDGIVKLWDYAKANKIDDLTQDFLNLLAQISDNNQRFYPGSPFIIAKTLREQDRAIFNELHPEDFPTLKENITEFKRNCECRKLRFDNSDGYQTLKAKLPPVEKRGLVFIDPPFEKTDEYDLIIDGLSEGLKRFSGGVFAVWLAIKDDKQLYHYFNKLREFKKDVLYIEFTLRDSKSKGGLTKMGLSIINPPFNIEQMLKPALLTLKKALWVDEYTNFELKTL